MKGTTAVIIFLLIFIFSYSIFGQGTYTYKKVTDGYQVVFQDSVYYVPKLPDFHVKVFKKNSLYKLDLLIYGDDYEIEDILIIEQINLSSLELLKKKYTLQILDSWFKRHNDNSIGWERIE
jgi:hypothetical protein